MRGIDYGMGQTNIDHETGIRYGVISAHSVSPFALDDMESDYGEPTCPECGNPAVDCEHEEYEGDSDFWCPCCGEELDSDQVYGDEPCGQYVDDGVYKVVDCLDSDLMVIKSPYFTHTDLCSPCVPGAGNLDGYCPDGVKTYCLGHDWFEDGKAPYPVYSVETGEEVQPESH